MRKGYFFASFLSGRVPSSTVLRREVGRAKAYILYAGAREDILLDALEAPIAAAVVLDEGGRVLSRRQVRSGKDLEKSEAIGTLPRIV